MRAFAELLDSLTFQPARDARLRLVAAYLASTPDPDRGHALAALTGEIALPNVKPALLRALATERVGETLFGLSHDYVGDLAETVALLWGAPRTTPDPVAGHNHPPLSLVDAMEGLRAAAKPDIPPLLAGWLDGLDATGRRGLLKLVTGGPRVGVSTRLAKQAIADFGGVSVDAVEEVWHRLRPPYLPLFDWLTRGGPRPESAPIAFRPTMLAHPLDEANLADMNPADWRAEWKWDGVRVQLVADGTHRRLYTRTGEDITGGFPEIAGAMTFDAVLDGELLIVHRDAHGRASPRPFADLRQRLNRKTATARAQHDFPAHVRLYDLLVETGEDLRALSFDRRRARLEAWIDRHQGCPFDASPLLPVAAWDELVALRAGARDTGIEGVMLKRADAPYVAGRPAELWLKWKRAALTLDCVLMYAQRGHGERSSYHSDFTFGCWRNGPDGAPELVPVGKAQSSDTDTELPRLDQWVRDHTLNRVGPVRAVEAGLVFEIAFDGAQRSTRHKSGVALRFPRIHRIRWDKPAAEADRLETLERMIAG